MKGLRSLAALVVGYAVFVISAVALFQLSGRDPHGAQPAWFMAASTAYGILFAGLGGSLASRIAPTRPRLHAFATAGILAAGAIASLLSSPATDATWSMWGALLLMAPACCVGGMLGDRT
jgi:hypothetical protein